MGMAASQARFLGLTARKSNVEYQGQQINQQRTALSNESANLYNQMMELTVPTPPSTSEFYKTSYVLEGSQADYATGNYKIETMSKTYNAEGEYTVTLTHDREYTASNFASYGVGSISQDKTTKVIKIPLMDGEVTAANLSYDADDTSAFKTTNDKKSLSITKNQIYLVSAKDAKNGAISGFDECYKIYGEGERAEIDSEGIYFYQDNNGRNNFMTVSQFDDLIKQDTNGNFTYNSNSNNAKFPVSRMYGYTKPETTQVIANLEKSSTTGRFTSIKIADNDSYPAVLQGMQFSLTTVNEMNQEAYDDAFNDYEYNKTKYEKSISDINAQTEIIQNEDQQLELRLQQLNTEQNAISTEMDSVTKVIEDNVEKTFKVFA